MSIEESAEGGQQESEDSGPQANAKGEKRAWKVPLSFPPGKPSRLVELEAKVIEKVKAMFDDIEAIDLAIAEVSEAIGDVMCQRATKIGVDWRPARRRAGRHPVVYKGATSGGQGGSLWLTQKNGANGSSGGFVRRRWVDPVDPPVALGRYAERLKPKSSVERDPREKVMRVEAQVLLLKSLEELLASREGAVLSMGRFLQSIAAWSRNNRSVPNPELPTVVCLMARDALEATRAVRLEQVTVARAKAMAAASIASLNDADDEGRVDGFRP